MTNDSPAQPAPAAAAGSIYRADRITLHRQDVLEGLACLPDGSFDLAIADPPYGASSGADWGLERGHGLPGFGGPWRLAGHAWDRPGDSARPERGDGVVGLGRNLPPVEAWLAELKRLVRPTGSIWIHATYHNSGFVNVACQMSGLEIINEVVWYKRNAFPNLSGRRLTASHETILWVHTGGPRREYRFNYEAAKTTSFPGDSLKRLGRQLRTVWDIPSNKPPAERRHGRHPTQKPLRLVERMLLVSAAPGGRLLAPFAGSGTEMIAGRRFGLECVGFESDPVYFDLAVRRITDEVANPGPWDGETRLRQDRDGR